MEDETKLPTAHSLWEFCNHHKLMNSIDVANLFATVDALRSEQLLLAVDGNTSLDGRFACVNFDERRAQYGEYEYRVLGFSRVINRLSGAVIAIEVETAEGIPTIGTGFFLGNHHTIITARHVVEAMRSVRIVGGDDKPYMLHRVAVAADPRLDLATLLVEGDDTRPSLRSSEAHLLDEVLCVGYPPIPGFDAIQVAEPARVIAQKATSGHVVAISSSYLEPATELMLLSARIKGGSSGGPVLDKKGYCVGLTVATPVSAQDAERLDELGYGLALPSTVFSAVLKDSDALDLPVQRLHDCAVRTLR